MECLVIAAFVIAVLSIIKGRPLWLLFIAIPLCGLEILVAFAKFYLGLEADI